MENYLDGFLKDSRLTFKSVTEALVTAKNDDVVLTLNSETGEIEEDTVDDTYFGYVSYIYTVRAGDYFLAAGPEQEVYVVGQEYYMMNELEAGHFLFTEYLESVEVEEVKRIYVAAPVATVSLANSEVMFVNGILVRTM